MGYGVSDMGCGRRFHGSVENLEPSHFCGVTGYGRRFRGNVGNVAWLVREAAAEYGLQPSDPELASDLDPAGAEADRLLELADEIVVLSAHIQAAVARLLELVAEFDRLGGWRVDGHRTCAHWLAHHTGLDLGAAREKVVARPENETDLLSSAEGASAAGVERLVRSWREHDALDEAALERERHRSRRLTVVPDDEGMYVVRGRLDPEAGAVLLRALEAAEDALFGEDRQKALDEMDARVREELGGSLSPEARALIDPAGTCAEPPLTTPQRRADALGLVAEQALARGFGDEAAPLSGARVKRYEVVLHVERATLATGKSPASRSSRTASAFPRKRLAA